MAMESKYAEEDLRCSNSRVIVRIHPGLLARVGKGFRCRGLRRMFVRRRGVHLAFPTPLYVLAEDSL